jgi:hypothetical protein
LIQITNCPQKRRPKPAITFLLWCQTAIVRSARITVTPHVPMTSLTESMVSKNVDRGEQAHKPLVMYTTCWQGICLIAFMLMACPIICISMQIRVTK